MLYLSDARARLMDWNMDRRPSLTVSLLIVTCVLHLVSCGDIPSNRKCEKKGVFCLDVGTGFDFAFDESISRSNILFSLTLTRSPDHHSWNFWFSDRLEDHMIDFWTQPEAGPYLVMNFKKAGNVSLAGMEKGSPNGQHESIAGTVGIYVSHMTRGKNFIQFRTTPNYEAAMNMETVKLKPVVRILNPTSMETKTVDTGSFILLFEHKVLRKQGLGLATIILIVLSVLVVLLILGIVCLTYTSHVPFMSSSMSTVTSL